MPARISSPEARVARLEARFHAFRAEVLAWQLEHARHHVRNEARWGLVALMREHPFRTLVMGLAIGLALAAGPGEGILAPLVRWCMEVLGP
ncbi:hypothetical protein ACFL45_07810 [Candidatus Neomarinimicrobiota bacterium]